MELISADWPLAVKQLNPISFAHACTSAPSDKYRREEGVGHLELETGASMRIATFPLLLLAPALVSGIISFRNVNRPDVGRISNVLHYLGDHIIGNPQQLQTEGIFRLAPSQTSLDNLMALLKQGDLTSPSLSDTMASADPSLAPAAFKRYIGLIPGKIFSYEVFNAFKQEMDAIPTLERQVEASMEGKDPTEIEDAKKKFAEAKTKAALDRAVASLDPERLETLGYIFRVMREVSQHADKNKMGIDNLLLMFAPNMVSTDPDDVPSKGKGIQVRLFAKKSASKGFKTAADPNAIMKNLEMAERMIRLLLQVYPGTVAESRSPSADSPSSSFSSSFSR